MAVRIVTDSTSDIPLPVAKEMGITIIPQNVHFGDEVYRDGIDISNDDFYKKLIKGPAFPTTSQASAGIFAQTYETLAKDTALRQAQDTAEILSVHISSKLSGTYNSALLGRREVSGPCRIEVVDSLLISMGLGLVVIALAREAKAGATMDQLLARQKELVQQIEIYSVADTLEFLQKGGRVSRLQAFFGSLLNIKPILHVMDGEVHLKERVRSRSQGVDRLVDIVEKAGKLADLSVLYTTAPKDAQALAARLDPFYPEKKARIYQHGSTMGVHLGPGALGVTFLKASAP